MVLKTCYAKREIFKLMYINYGMRKSMQIWRHVTPSVFRRNLDAYAYHIKRLGLFCFLYISNYSGAPIKQTPMGQYIFCPLL